MPKPEDTNALSEAALALDRELRRFDELSAQATRIKLTTEKSVERATEALTRAAECQDRIHAHVQQLVAAVGAARLKQETDAAALMRRAEQIAARRKEFADVMQRMAGLGQMAKEVQDSLRAGPSGIEDVQGRIVRERQEARHREEHRHEDSLERSEEDHAKACGDGPPEFESADAAYRLDLLGADEPDGVGDHDRGEHRVRHRTEDRGEEKRGGFHSSGCRGTALSS